MAGRYYRGILRTLSIVYGVVVSAREWMYKKNIKRKRRLKTTTVCVGGVTLGGSGKTPIVRMVCEWFRERGLKVVVLTRGYGRRKRKGEVVVLGGEDEMEVDVEEVGDEPWWLWKVLGGIPVVVGSKRYEAGRNAEELFNPDILVLDDGFQHFQLERDLNIVVLSGGERLEAMSLAPEGRLREPLTGLSRADMIVLSKVNLVEGEGVTEEHLRDRGISCPVVRSNYKICSIRSLESGELIDIGEMVGKKVLLVCGIGNPEGFVTLVEQGLEACVVEVISKRDHHWYSLADMEMVEEKLRASDAEWAITTEKDEARLCGKGFPLRHWVSLGIAAEIIKEDEIVINKILSNLHNKEKDVR